VLIRSVVLSGSVLLAFSIGVGGGLAWETTRTLGFTTLVLVQLAYVYALRISESGWRDGTTRNAKLHLAVLVSVVLQVLVVATPVGNHLFATTPLTGWQWLLALGLSCLAALITIFISASPPRLASQV
jgi:magnesium-transporting ATPase (P-type)